MKNLIEQLKSVPLSVILSVIWILLIVGMLVMIFPGVAFVIVFIGGTAAAVWKISTYLDERDRERRWEKGSKKGDWSARPLHVDIREK